MKPFGPALAVLTLAAVLCPTVSASAQQKSDKPAAKVDTVTFTDNTGAVAHNVTRKDGRVDTADFDKVDYAVGGKKTSIPAADVIEIKWGDDPGDYEKGVRALQAREPDTARKSFESTLLAKAALPDLRSWVDEYANCGLGEANLLLTATDTKAADRAAEAFSKALAANGKSLVLDRILQGLANAESARKKPEAALKAADDLIVAAKAAKRPAWEVSANLLKARVQLATGNVAGAVSAFDDAVRLTDGAISSEKNENTKARLRASGIEAAVGKGWTLFAKAEADKSQAGMDAAKSYFDGLGAKYPGDPIVLAAAANAEGRAKLAAGDARAAQRIFARAEVYYFQAADEVAQSLYYQALCWKALGDDKLRAERTTDLKELFPTSEWARKAQ